MHRAISSRSSLTGMARLFQIGIVAGLLALALLPLLGTNAVSAANDGEPIVLAPALQPGPAAVERDPRRLIDRRAQLARAALGPGAFAPAASHAPISPKPPASAAIDPSQWAGLRNGRLIPLWPMTTPASLRIASVGIDASIETLEIVDGAMQDPTNADQVAWYKETAQLGEPGNVVMAGHLNWWGIPEGVFYRLADVKKHDVIEVIGADSTVYRYKVQGIKQVDVATADVAKLVGPTKKPSLTLITCGGTWNAAAQEYDQRTVVRAVLVSE